MLIRPPPPQCRSFFVGVQPLHGCWQAIIRVKQKKKHDPVLTCVLVCLFTASYAQRILLRHSQHFFLCSCAFWVLLRTIVRSTHLYFKPGGLILNLESQRCDCHLIVIRSKLASAFVSFLQLILYYPSQSVHVTSQGTAGVVIAYDFESRHGCWRHILFSHYAIIDADSRSLTWVTTPNACALQSPLSWSTALNECALQALFVSVWPLMHLMLLAAVITCGGLPCLSS